MKFEFEIPDEDIKECVLGHYVGAEPVSDLDEFPGLAALQPYDVECARCGAVLSCRDAYLEEGDEWECPACFERCNAAESHPNAR